MAWLNHNRHSLAGEKHWDNDLLVELLPSRSMGGSMVSAHNTNRLHIWHNGRINLLSSKSSVGLEKQRVVLRLDSAKFHQKTANYKVYSWRKIWKPLRKLRKFLQPSKNSPHSCLFCIHGNRETYIWLLLRMQFHLRMITTYVLCYRRLNVCFANNLKYTF